MFKKRIVVGIGIFIILAFLAVPALANGEKSEFSGTSYLMAFLDPGIVTHPDGNEHVRGMVLQYDDIVEEGDARVGGTDTIVVNYNVQSVPLPGLIAGPMWGTIRVENEDGYWEGIWTGERTEEGFLYGRGVYHGRGGYEGLKAKFYIERLSPDPAAPTSFWGYIIDPASE
jgi:hypothetical protein